MQFKPFIGCVIILTICLAIGTQVAAESKIYWVDDFGDKIQRANLDGSGLEDVLMTRRLMSPSSIALDVAGGKMYWINNRADTIQRANLDGTEVEDLVMELDSPQDMALDVDAGKIYWTELEGKIQRANLDGSGVVEVLQTGLGDSLIGIALDVAGGKMYLTFNRRVTVQRANLDGSELETLVIPGFLEGSGGGDIALDLAGGKMYWAAGFILSPRIRRANLDGSEVEDLVNVRSSAIALDVSSGKMYWWGGENQFQRANLDGSGIEDVLAVGLKVRGLALALDDLGGSETGAGSPPDGGGGTSDITWDVTGVDVDLVVCKNKTTGQKGRIDVGVPASGSCGDLGLVWDSGDNVQVKAVGTVVSVADAGGNVTGIAANLLVCKNRSSDPPEKVRVDNPGSPWNCTDEGLPLAVGESLQWKAKGPAN